MCHVFLAHLAFYMAFCYSLWHILWRYIRGASPLTEEKRAGRVGMPALGPHNTQALGMFLKKVLTLRASMPVCQVGH